VIFRLIIIYCRTTGGNVSRVGIIRAELNDDPTDLGYAELGQNYPAIADLMNQRPMVDMALQMYVAIGAPDLSQQSIAALTALMTATEADPNWSAQIPGNSRATVLGVAPVRATDVQEAMN
jgi:hypothetical protein